MENPPGKTIGERVRRLRRDMSLARTALAEKVGISDVSLLWIETGKHKPRADVLVRLSEVLDVSTDYLLGRIGEEEEIVSDPRLRLMFKEVKDLPKEDIELIWSLIRRLQREAVDPQQRGAGKQETGKHPARRRL